MKPGEIVYSAHGLSETTVELIRSMGPLLLGEGPDGRTPLQYVEAMLGYARASSSQALGGVYSQIKSQIEIELITKVEKQRKANGEPCWSS